MPVTRQAAVLDVPTHWSTRGLCATSDPEIWTEINSKRDVAVALRYCRWCPVLAECNADAEAKAGTTEAYLQVVAGGVYWNAQGKPTRWAA